MSFTYQLPSDFKRRVYQLLEQLKGKDLANAFNRITYEWSDEGLSYYAGIRGDNWDKHAAEFEFDGSADDIELLRKNEVIVKKAITKALKSEESGLQILGITYFDSEEELPDAYLPGSDEERLNADLEVAKAVYIDLIKVGERVCLNANYNENSTENSINDYIRDGLCFMGYNEVKDQSRHGLSGNRKDAGEVDILLTKDGKEIAIFEGLKLTSIDKSYINAHLEKAVVNYNALGTATYIVAYVISANFSIFWSKYMDYLKSYKFPLTVKHELEELPAQNAAIRSSRTILSREGYDFPVYIMAFNIEH